MRRIFKAAIFTACLALIAFLFWLGADRFQQIFRAEVARPAHDIASSAGHDLARSTHWSSNGDIFSRSPGEPSVGLIRVALSQDLSFPNENQILALSAGQSSELHPPDWPILPGLEGAVWSASDASGSSDIPGQGASTSSTGSGGHGGPGVSPDYPIVGGGSPGNGGTNPVKTPEPASAALLAIALLVMTSFGALRKARTKHI